MAAKPASPFSTTELKGGSATSSYNANPILGINNNYVPGSGTGGSTGSVNPLSLQTTMDELLGFQSQATELKAASDASLVSVAGAKAEADAYQHAADYAGGNQQTEALAEQVREYQIDRSVNKTVGSEKAAVAANGFTQSGSGLDIMASSYRQGYLQTQISAMNSEEVQRGYLESQAASQGDVAAANVRAQGAQTLSDAQLAASNAATANAGALTSAMTSLLAGDESAQALVTALTTGDTAGALAATATYNPNGPGAPLGEQRNTAQPQVYTEPK